MILLAYLIGLVATAAALLFLADWMARNDD